MRFALDGTTLPIHLHILFHRYYRGASAILLFYDVTEYTSFRNLTEWLDNIGRYADPSVIIKLVGNKCHLLNKKVVSTSEAKEFAGMVNYIIIILFMNNT